MTATHSHFIVSINLILSSVNFTTNNASTRLNYIILFYSHCQWQGRALIPYIFVVSSTTLGFCFMTLFFNRLQHRSLIHA